MPCKIKKLATEVKPRGPAVKALASDVMGCQAASQGLEQKVLRTAAVKKSRNVG